MAGDSEEDRDNPFEPDHPDVVSKVRPHCAAMRSVCQCLTMINQPRYEANGIERVDAVSKVALQAIDLPFRSRHKRNLVGRQPAL